MKRFFAVCTVVLMVAVLCCVPAFAAGSESYYLEEMDADIALPSWDDYYFLYPDMPEDSLDLEYLGMTAQEINDILVPDGILLAVLYYDYTHEIDVQMSQDELSAELFNFKELSTLEREVVLAAYSSMLEGAGYVLDRSGWGHSEDAEWLVLEYTMPGADWYCQYITVCNGKMLTLTALEGDSGELAEAREVARNTIAMMATETRFHVIEDTPEGVGGITGNVVQSVLDEIGMSSIDLSHAGLGTLDLSSLDLSGLDLDALVEAAGLTTEEAVMLVRGELDPSQLDLSKADPQAIVDALGVDEDVLADMALSAVGVDRAVLTGTLLNIGRSALTGFVVGVLGIVVLIVVFSVIGSVVRKKQRAAAEE